MATIYPSTRAGVLSFLHDPEEIDQTFVKNLDPERCVMLEDLYVDGVWLVSNKKNGLSCLVFLAGHKDSCGRVRDLNDFEVGGE